MTSSFDEIFGSHGPLARALPGFTVRTAQRRMAERIALALAERGSLVVEAGTGTGKTFAYLVPALLSGCRVLISTGTRTLQDQLFSKDLPLIAAALGRPARIAVLKGRSNYLCRQRLALAEVTGSDMLARIERWARTTRSGDLAEVRELSDSSSAWSQVTSTRENCLGTRCPEIARCHLALARRAALDADIVIVNHHLLLADLILKEDGFGDILGACDAVILDEAHQIPDLASQFFGATVGSRQIEHLVRDAQLELAQLLEGQMDPQLARSLRAAMAESLYALQQSSEALAEGRAARAGRLAWSELGPVLTARISQLAAALESVEDCVAGVEPESGCAQIGARARELAVRLRDICALDDLEGLRALEVTPGGFVLSLMPFDISKRFQSLMQAHRCAWVFTSATLSVGEDFSHFTGRLGLDEAATLQIDSPFDYSRQGMLYLPAGMPEPASAGFLGAVVELAARLIDAAAGGAFLLFTSHRALNEAARRLRERWGSHAPYPLFVQGEAPRERLLTDFRASGNAVLLGTTSFWEGVDVKGEALRLVIIEKLPFASPEDPLVRARIEHLEANGRNAFRESQLPEAALMLKQGVGRLIRSESDFGAVAICDPRIVNRPYGRVFLTALPPFEITREPRAVLDFLKAHAPVTGSADPRCRVVS